MISAQSKYQRMRMRWYFDCLNGSSQTSIETDRQRGQSRPVCFNSEPHMRTTMPCYLHVAAVGAKSERCSASLQQLGCKPAQLIVCMRRRARVCMYTLTSSSSDLRDRAVHTSVVSACSSAWRRAIAPPGRGLHRLTESALANVHLFRSIAASCDATDRGAILQRAGRSCRT